MGKIMINGKKYGGTTSTMAKDITFDRAGGTLTSSNLQDVVNELDSKVSEQNENLQWYIDNGFLPDPNSNKLLIMANGKLLNGQSVVVGENTLNYTVSFENITNALEIKYKKTTSDNVDAYGVALLNEAIDVTQYSKVKMVYDLVEYYCHADTSLNTHWTGKFGLAKSKSDFIKSTTKYSAVERMSEVIGNSFTVELDVSNLSGTHYLAITHGSFNPGIFHMTARCKDIWLE